MDRALFLSMSGAKQDMQSLQLRANNLANVSTTGFRADLEQARAMQVYGEGFPTRVFNMTERPSYNYTQGSTITTGRELDVAIKGDGWLAVYDGSGQESYTRVGNLKLDQTGLLRNGQGHLILGEGDAPISLPLSVSTIEIGTDGTVSVLPQGAQLEAMEKVNRIKLVRPDQVELFKDKNGVFKPIIPGTIYAADASVTLLTGALEGSNVNAIGEMTGIINLQRHFEMQIKLMKTVEEMDQASNSLLSMG
ncbi:flagellar basal body rod protein FlgF [Candidatus Enterovibrio escicola]|uniref:Flagellar basal-body rod protein FlgF n=1 Tax=Candidatus Enterovibrio escicola TaxID=1927127 RepID=A0A2A5T1C7_9GAMM|nr:flagellar basal body rod protein FlgF [Candidatus Enterovibrio escacola]PCS21967.1 Flagellar basal-body rod protein FlgF [Candidatus Enterovibrio escacola]